MFNRRLFIAGAAASGLAAPALVRAQSIWRNYPFSLGVASGDPSSDGFVIWTRLAPEPLEPRGGMPRDTMAVTWEIASDSGFTKDVRSGEVLARPELGHSVHVEVTGLLPDRPYFYRFTAGGERSLRGTARTLPMPGAAISKARFAVCGCQHYEDGFFGAYRHLAREDVNFVYHYGDFIYEYGLDYIYPGGLPAAPVRLSGIRGLMDVTDFRFAYAQQLGDVDLQAARSRHVFLASYDDHEVRNNWVADNDDWSRDPADKREPVSPELFALRKQAAMQAWYEFMPVRRALLPRNGAVGMHREFQMGNLLGLQVLDTRLYRSNQPCGDGFKPLCNDVNKADTQVLGSEQEAWLARNLAGGGQIWEALAQQITMMSLDRRRRPEEPAKIANMDSWAGYETARQRVLSRFSGRRNNVVLTGDEHQNFCGDLVQRDKIVGSEFVATSISSGGNGSDVRIGTDQWLKYNPELKFANDQRGYMVCDVTPDAWQSHYMVVDQVTVRDPKLSRRMTAVVARDEAGIKLSA
jgi:alkaline phosphatase D